MDVKRILLENGFRFEKKYGQNFILDQNILDSIVDAGDVDQNTTVIEIGVGAGTLTGAIAKRVKKVYGFEIDQKLKPVLLNTLSSYDNVEIIFKDVMKVSMQKIEQIAGGKYTLIANLPYYITTPIIMRFIEESSLLERIVVTVQKEVALRLSAKPKTSDYGAITASINAVGDATLTTFIGREKFLPPPNVDSAVVRIDINRNKYNIESIESYRKMVKNAFLMRRKTLVNNLIQGYNITRERAESVLNEVGLPLNVRGEELSSEDFINLSKILK